MQLTAAVPASLISSPAAKSRMRTVDAGGRRNEGRAVNKGRPGCLVLGPPLGRGLSHGETKEIGSPGPGPPGRASATPAGSARGHTCRGKTCSRPPTSTGSLFLEPAIQASACRQLGRHQPRSHRAGAPGSHVLPAQDTLGPRWGVGRSPRPRGEAPPRMLKAWLMGFLVLTNSSGQSDVSLTVTLLCFLAVNEIIRNDLSSTNIRS